MEMARLISSSHVGMGMISTTRMQVIPSASAMSLRNKLKQYTGEGVSVPLPGELDRATL